MTCYQSVEYVTLKKNIKTFLLNSQHLQINTVYVDFNKSLL